MIGQSITIAAATLDEPARALHQVLARAFGRLPTDAEMAAWQAKLDRGISARRFLDQLSESRAFLANNAPVSKTQPGHFYSPVVDPPSVHGYVAMNRESGLAGLQGVDFPLEDMAKFWHANAACIAASPFPETNDGAHRYAYGGGPYKHGDAITLLAMMNHYRPRKIVEIGSGYSTACMLDSADHLNLAGLQLTCIDPNPGRLNALLRPGDAGRLSLHAAPVQGAPLALFESLERNDILFIDSSHVLKTGSDVHYELFYILPRLRPGVLVHFHDCRFPFEYSDRQIFTKNYSWNEVYAVRALLMYSTRFRIVFHASLFAETYRELASMSAAFKTNPGSALWVEVLP